MRLANYTTTVPVEKSIGEITALLMSAHVCGILTEFENGVITAIKFSIKRGENELFFRLPCDWRATLNVLNRDHTVPGRFKNSGQAKRVAWRIQRDSIRANLSLWEIGCVKIEEVMLPYMLADDGKTTVYKAFENKGFSGYALPAPKGI